MTDKEKPPYYQLKKWERIIDTQCTIFVICVILLLLLIMIGSGIDNMTMQDILTNIGISVLSGSITSITLSIFIYYKYLKRIPDENKKKIEELLDKRLCYESSNHNAILQAVTPHNRDLQNSSTKEHEGILSYLQYLRDKAAKDEGRRESMNIQQIDLDNVGKQISSLVAMNVELTLKVNSLEEENIKLRYKLREKNQNVSYTNNFIQEQDEDEELEM